MTHQLTIDFEGKETRKKSQPYSCVGALLVGIAFVIDFANDPTELHNELIEKEDPPGPLDELFQSADQYGHLILPAILAETSMADKKSHYAGGQGQLTNDGPMLGTASESYRGGSLDNKTPYGLSSGHQCLQDNSDGFAKRKLKSVLGYFVNRQKTKRVAEYAAAHVEAITEKKMNAIRPCWGKEEKMKALESTDDINSRVAAGSVNYVKSTSYLDDRINANSTIEELKIQYRSEIGRFALAFALMVAFFGYMGPASMFLKKMLFRSPLQIFPAIATNAVTVESTWTLAGSFSRLHRLKKAIDRKEKFLNTEDERNPGGLRREDGRKAAQAMKSDVVCIERKKQLSSVTRIVNSAAESIENTAKRGPIYLGEIVGKRKIPDDVLAKQRGDPVQVAKPKGNIRTSLPKARRLINTSSN